VLSVGVLFLGVMNMVKGFKFFQSLCLFYADVVCPHRNSEAKRKRFSMAKFCVGLKCKHFVRFEREMDAEDERVMDEIDAIRLAHGDFDV